MWKQALNTVRGYKFTQKMYVPKFLEELLFGIEMLLRLLCDQICWLKVKTSPEFISVC